jgi:hypothetical protein
VTAHLLAKEYGKRPSDFLNGGVHEFNLDAEILMIGKEAEADAIKKAHA